ncbi:hypothetical protein ACFDR9_002616 [Janthinobacterium sp. CG_23.3]|uniref:hypothetical protein n=1 Tax=Janthinobacterium sp. CG_23.3 TaxID=3349634 RepID=UPI0038D3585A
MSKRIYIKNISALILASLASTAWADENGYVLRSAVWSQSTIPVCWINPSTVNSAERSWVKTAVERTWARSSRLSFTGWESTCPVANQGNAVRIKIQDDNPRVQVLGKQVTTFSEGMFLNCDCSAAMRQAG